MRELLSLEHADARSSESACFRNQTVHQHPMCLEQALPARRLPLRQTLVRFVRVDDLSDVLVTPEDALALEHRGDLIDRERVTFDCHRSLHRPYLIALAEQRLRLAERKPLQSAQTLVDSAQRLEENRSELKGWRHPLIVSGDTITDRRTSGRAALAGTSTPR